VPLLAGVLIKALLNTKLASSQNLESGFYLQFNLPYFIQKPQGADLQFNLPYFIQKSQDADLQFNLPYFIQKSQGADLQRPSMARTL
jgi:hypothetical protein